MKKEYVADLSALCGAERFTFSEGKAKGIDAVRLYNGKLDLTVILDRCMDIFRLFIGEFPFRIFQKTDLFLLILRRVRHILFSAASMRDLCIPVGWIILESPK